MDEFSSTATYDYGGALPPYLYLTASPLVALSVSLRGYRRERK